MLPLLLLLLLFTQGVPHVKRLTGPGLSPLFGGTGGNRGEGKRAELVETSSWLGAAEFPKEQPQNEE